jgi:hypothetical protein
MTNLGLEVCMLKLGLLSASFDQNLDMGSCIIDQLVEAALYRIGKWNDRSDQSCGLIRMCAQKCHDLFEILGRVGVAACQMLLSDNQSIQVDAKCLVVDRHVEDRAAGLCTFNRGIESALQAVRTVSNTGLLRVLKVVSVGLSCGDDFAIGLTTTSAPNDSACAARDSATSLATITAAPLARRSMIRAHPIGPVPKTSTFCPARKPEILIMCAATASGSARLASLSEMF